jgi:tRNA A-37 threonylcarbamoyl transferase component Bud32
MSEPVRWRAAPGVAQELCQSLSLECASWFGPGRRPLPRALHKEHLALVDSPLGPLVAKRELARGWKRPLVALRARPLRSARAFALGLELLARELPTPAPVAVLVRPGPAREAVLLTRYVEGSGPWEYLRSGGPAAELCATLASALARLHAAGFRHRDLKASNLLLAPGPELFWTDLEGLRARGTLLRFERMRDLARLRMSFESAEARAAGVRADHWPALVRAYLEASGAAAGELGAYLARTRAWSERAMRRHLARGQAIR